MNTTHKFAVGQVVRFVVGPRDIHIPAGSFTVQRQLPSETNDLQYRVKHQHDGHERVVRESQLRGPDSVV